MAKQKARAILRRNRPDGGYGDDDVETMVRSSIRLVKVVRPEKVAKIPLGSLKELNL